MIFYQIKSSCLENTLPQTGSVYHTSRRKPSTLPQQCGAVFHSDGGRPRRREARSTPTGGNPAPLPTVWRGLPFRWRPSPQTGSACHNCKEPEIPPQRCGAAFHSDGGRPRRREAHATPTGGNPAPFPNSVERSSIPMETASRLWIASLSPTCRSNCFLIN